MDYCYHHYHPVLPPSGTEPRVMAIALSPRGGCFFQQLAWYVTWEHFSMVKKERGQAGGGRYRWVVCGEQEFSNLELRQYGPAAWALVWLLILSNSTLPLLPQPPTAVPQSSVGRQKQLCTLAASAVPTAVWPRRIPGAIKYLGGCCRPSCVSWPQMPGAQVWMPLCSCSCDQKIVRKRKWLFNQMVQCSQIHCLLMCTIQWELISFLLEKTEQGQ